MMFAIRSIAATVVILGLSGLIPGLYAEKCPFADTRNAAKTVYRYKRQLSTTCPYSQVTCSTDEIYRTVDGSCNNVQTNSLWGRAGTPQRRLVDVTYADGVHTPRVRGSRGLGGPLPDARFASMMINQDDTFLDFTRTGFTHFMMQWGQFIDHDITLTPTMTNADGSEPICCVDDLPDDDHSTQLELNAKEECFVMMLNNPNPDRYFNRTCLNFVRSAQTHPLDCSTDHVEQINSVTSFIDGSQIYGSSADIMAAVRNGSTPYLNTSPGNLLPHADHGDHCVRESDFDFCYYAGDVRSNVQPGLTSLHTLFLREHNRIAKHFSENNGDWSDNKIFFETRKILGAILQHVTYDHWLPDIFGDSYSSTGLLSATSGFSDVYDPTLDPRISTEFSTAAYRFGHSMIQSYIDRIYGTFNTSTRLREMFGRARFTAEDDGEGVDRMLGGLVSQVEQRGDRWYSLEITDHLFETEPNHSQDLAALNAQRGRDHGLGTYNDIREWCNLNRPTVWQHGDVAGGFPEMLETPVTRLSKTYNETEDIDFYQGGISELSQGSGAEIGVTFLCVLEDQFSRLKKGDRFWYERNDAAIGFTEAQIDSIKTVTLSRLICDNTRISRVQRNVFRQPRPGSRRNDITDCSDDSIRTGIPALNLSLWS